MTRAIQTATNPGSIAAQTAGVGPAGLLAADWLAALDLDMPFAVDAPPAPPAPGEAALAEARGDPRERGRRFENALAVEWSAVALALPNAPPSDEPTIATTPDDGDADAPASGVEAAAASTAREPVASAEIDVTASTPRANAGSRASAPDPALGAPRAADRTALPPTRIDGATASRGERFPSSTADARDASGSEAAARAPQATPGTQATQAMQATQATTAMPRSSRSWHVEPNTRVTVELGGAEQSTVAAIAHDARDASAEPAVATEAESPAQPTAPIPFTTSDLLDAHRVAHERPVPLTAARHEPTPSAPETSWSEARPAETKSSALVPDVPVDPSPRIASTNDSAGSVSTPSESDLASAAAPPDADAAAPTDPTVATEPRPRGKDRDGASVDASSRGHADASVGARPPRPSGRFDGEPGEGGERSRSSSKPEPAPLSRRTSERRFDATDAGSAHSATTVPSEPANPGLPPPGVTAPERAAPSTAPSTSPERASPDPASGEVATPKTLRMTLEPPDGGSVEVRLELRGESVHAHIVTSDPGLGASLDSGRDDLREHFRQQHLELAHLDVSTGGGSQGTFTQDPRDDRSPSWRDRDDERAITTTSGASARRVLQPSVRAVGGSEGSRALDVRA